MSPINFDTLQANYPKYTPTWNALREWFKRNRRKEYVELAVLADALKKRVDPVTIVAAVRLMVDHEMLAVAYRVRTPAGDLLEGEFDEPSKIPDELWERGGNRKMPTGDGELVSGFRWGAADAN